MGTRTCIDKTTRNYKQFIADLPRGKEIVGAIADEVNTIKMTGDLQATNAAGSGGADETYYVMLGKPGAPCNALKAYVRNKWEVGAGAGFPAFVSVQFFKRTGAGVLTAITGVQSLTGLSAYLEIDITDTTARIDETCQFAAVVTVPAAVTVALGFDLDIRLTK